MLERFKNRREGGWYLADRLSHYRDKPGGIVLALPRGGVPVGYEVAQELRLPLDLFFVRKLGVPGHEEFAMGALASGDVTLLNEDVVHQLRIPESEIRYVIEKEQRELHRRESKYGDRVPHNLEGRTVILVDDGLATGSTMKVAVEALRQRDPRHIVVGVPVAPASAAHEFRHLADEFVCVLEPQMFYAVGEWYEDFSQTTDEEVSAILNRARSFASV